VAGIVAALIVLFVFPRLDEYVSRVSKDDRVYEVVAPYDEGRWPALETRLRAAGLTVHLRHVGRQGDSMVIVASTRGPLQTQEAVTAELLSDTSLDEVSIR
jgi:hypothetical protein